MKLWRKEHANPEPMVDPKRFIGTVKGERPAEGDPGVGGNCMVVFFENGADNKFHSHSVGELLVVIDGKGYVENEQGRVKVGPGDIVSTPPDEKLRHGALPGQNMAHLAI